MLVDAIASALAQTHQPIQVVIVIDHNRPLFDRCSAALADWTSPDRPPLLLLENAFEGRLGSARNTGVAECTGEVVAFLDDEEAATAAASSVNAGTWTWSMSTPLRRYVKRQ